MTTEAADTVKIENSLHRLQVDEIGRLMGFAEANLKRGEYRSLSLWIVRVLTDECHRRTVDDPDLHEPGMLTLPEWTPAEVGQALACATALTYQTLKPGEYKFADDLCCHIVALSAVMLDEYSRLMGQEDV